MVDAKAAVVATAISLVGLCFSSACREDERTKTSSNKASEPAVQSSQAASSNPALEVLPAHWRQDSDGDRIPDFIEKANGYDPFIDDCRADTDCGNGAAGSGKPIGADVLLILDASGSMVSKVGGQTKLDAAKASLENYASYAPKSVRLGFMVYGHKGDNSRTGKAVSCQGVDLLNPIGSVAPGPFSNSLQSFAPTGWTPIAKALEQARAAFRPSSNQRRIVLVSDGIETCGGDPAAVARSLQNDGLDVTVDVIGFGVSSSDARALRQIAEAGGGQYFDVRTRSELDAYFRRQSEAFKATIGAAMCERTANIDQFQCDSKRRNQAANVISQEMRTYKVGSAQWSALMTLRGQIISDTRRTAERQDRQHRARALDRQASGIVRQNLDTLDQQRRPGGQPREELQPASQVGPFKLKFPAGWAVSKASAPFGVSGESLLASNGLTGPDRAVVQATAVRDDGKPLQDQARDADRKLRAQGAVDLTVTAERPFTWKGLPALERGLTYKVAGRPVKDQTVYIDGGPHVLAISLLASPHAAEQSAATFQAVVARAVLS